MKRLRFLFACAALCCGLFYAGLAVEHGPALGTGPEPWTDTWCMEKFGGDGYGPLETVGASFRAGWRDGYVAGWFHVKGPNAIGPIVPIPPIPPLDRDTYSGGHGLGFVAGMNDAR
jgi:hypothetical protein